MTKAVETIRVLTSGGDALGTNTAIRAVARTAINKSLKIKGIMHGYTGLLEEEIVDMEPASVSGIINRGDTILHTAKYKEFTTAEDQQKGADIRRKHGIDGVAIIGGDGSFKGAGKLSSLGINAIGPLGTVDLDIACTDYAIDFNTAVNMAMEAVDKIRGTSAFHKRCSIVEVTRCNAGYITLWHGIRNGTKGILLSERYDGNEQALINRITDNRGRDKRHNIIINAGRTGHSGSMVKCTEAATGIETRATVLGHMQHGGTPTCKDRVYVSIMGAKAVELPAAGKSNRLVAYKRGELMDFDTQEALNVAKNIPKEQYEIAKMLIR